MPAKTRPRPADHPIEKGEMIPWGSLGALFFCSGALALVYEVLWHRQFSLFFGSAASASAAVLASFFAGLGIGSIVCGRWVGRFKRPLLVYAVLEAIVGVGALGVTPLIETFSRWYSEVASAGSSSAAQLLLLKGAMAFGAIAIPTIAMGGTLPVLAQVVDFNKERPGTRIGWLYLVNTSGAVLGALAFPLLFLPQLGMRNTTFACVAANGIIAIASILLASRLPVRERVGRDAPNRSMGMATLRAPFVLAALSGAGTFALQALWNRAFAQVHENSTFSFALIVSVFIAAIAAGAELARRLLRRKIPVQAALNGVWTAGGFLVMVSPLLFLRLSDNLRYVGNDELRTLFVLAASVIFIPVALLSAALPLLFEDAIGNSSGSAGRQTGAILSANIAGAIGGALLAGFILPPLLGMWKSVMVVGMLFLFGAVIFQRAPRPRQIGVRAVAAAVVILVSLDLPRARIDFRAGESLLALGEGSHGIVAVTEREGSRRLKLNNHYLLGGTSSVGDERMQGHIPLLLHPDPRKAVFLGYGTGITAGSATFHSGLEAIGVELVPEVGKFASRYFAESNGRFGAIVGTTLVIDDARHFLQITPGKFDVIMGDLVVPWRPGEGSLYTREHFAHCMAALSDGGLVCSWVPLFQLTQEQFQIILHTFLQEFPQAWIWRGDFSPDAPALALVGFKGSGFDPAAVLKRLEQMKPDPANPHLRFATAFFMHLVGVVEHGGAASPGTRINSDDRPWVELSPSGAGDRLFIGRSLRQWEESVRQSSAARIRESFPPEAVAGWESGWWMREFTLALSEGRQADAAAAQAHIGKLIDQDAFKEIFGARH